MMAAVAASSTVLLLHMLCSWGTCLLLQVVNVAVPGSEPSLLGATEDMTLADSSLIGRTGAGLHAAVYVKKLLHMEHVMAWLCDPCVRE
jgi:hypothetical protein